MKSHSRVAFHFELDGILSSKKSMIWAIRNKNKDKFYGLASWDKRGEQYTYDPDTDVHLTDKEMLEISKFLNELNFVHNNMEEKERLKKGSGSDIGTTGEWG